MIQHHLTHHLTHTGISVDQRFFRITEKEARFIALPQLLILEIVWRALEDAGITAEQIHRTR